MTETPETEPTPEQMEALSAERQAFEVATLKAQVDFLADRVAVLAAENVALRASVGN